MKAKIGFALLSLMLAAPAAADKIDVPPPSKAAALRQALTDYGQWLTRLKAVEQPALDAVGQVGPKWDRAVQGHTAKQISAIFRPEIARIKHIIAETNQGLATVDKPDFAILSLPADMTSPALVRQFTELNGHMTTMIDSFGPLIDAIGRNDRGATIIAARSTLSNAGLLVDSQIMLAKASLVTTAPESSTYDVMVLQIYYFQSASRLLKSVSFNPAPRLDPALPRDLEAIATDVDGIAVRGSEKLEREIAKFQAQGTDARARGESDRAALNDQLAAVRIADRRAFVLGKQLATLLRADAAQFRAQPPTMNRVGAAIHGLVPVRDGFDQVARDEDAAFAQAPRS